MDARQDRRPPRRRTPILTLNDSNSWVREAAAEALGDIGDPQAITPLTNVLKYDDDNHVRFWAVYALGEIGDLGIVDPLIQALDDSDSQVRSEAVAVLENISEPAFPSLIQVLSDPRSGIRSGAAEAIGEIGDPRAVAPLNWH